MLPECENCGETNAFALIDPQAAYCCQTCINDRANVKYSPDDKAYRRMAYCSCGKKGIINDGNFFHCGHWGCNPQDGFVGFLTHK